MGAETVPEAPADGGTPDEPRDWANDVIPELLAQGGRVFGEVMEGYWDQPDKTAEAIDARRCMRETWERNGGGKGYRSAPDRIACAATRCRAAGSPIWLIPLGGVIYMAALLAFRAIQLPNIPLVPDIAATPLSVPIAHKDPFDMLLLVHAQELGMKLLTRDEKLRDHPLAHIA